MGHEIEIAGLGRQISVLTIPDGKHDAYTLADELQRAFQRIYLMGRNDEAEAIAERINIVLTHRRESRRDAS